MLPDDPIPAADAIVGVGHPLNYLPDESAVDRALVAIARGAAGPAACSQSTCATSSTAKPAADIPNVSRVADDWAIITDSRLPAPNHFVRQMATFLRVDDGLVAAGRRAARQRAGRHGAGARRCSPATEWRRRSVPGFADEELSVGLRVVKGVKRAADRRRADRGRTSSAGARRRRRPGAAASAPASSTCGPKPTSRAAGATARTRRHLGAEPGQIDDHDVGVGTASASRTNTTSLTDAVIFERSIRSVTSAQTRTV